MTSAYFEEFEPIERFVAARKPQDVRPLEVRFNAIRGEVGAGLKGRRSPRPSPACGRRSRTPWAAARPRPPARLAPPSPRR